LDRARDVVHAGMQSLVELSPDLMVITDHAGRIEYVNGALGCGVRERLVGTSIYDVMAEPAAETFRACVARAQRAGAVECCEVDCFGGEPEARKIQWRMTPVWQSQQIVALAMHGRDMTERRPLDPVALDATRPEEEAQRRQRLEALAHAGRLSTMGQLVAAIAHEINQPLYAITNYAGACHNAVQSDTDKARTQLPHWIKEIEIQARRAALIISKLSDFVRKSPSHSSSFDLNKLVINSLDLLRLEARSRQVRAGLELASPVPMVRGDQIQIEQIIVNLLRNAFDALDAVPPGERRVAVKTEIAGDVVRVHVEDCGKGLTADELSRLFEPFFTTKNDGMGMGLPISRSIIEAHGGRLWATRNVTAGITMHFELPAPRDESSNSDA
jgi:PAS domain S-box-containing protein